MFAAPRALWRSRAWRYMYTLTRACHTILRLLLLVILLALVPFPMLLAVVLILFFVLVPVLMMVSLLACGVLLHDLLLRAYAFTLSFAQSYRFCGAGHEGARGIREHRRWHERRGF